MDDLLTVKQAAILLKVHPLTIRRYIIEGKLKAIKIGGNVRISQKSLQAFSETYIPNAKASKHATKEATTEPFSPSDSLFRLKGRGISLDNY